MNLLFTATTPADLAKVTWLIHDCFFDLDAARHAEGEGTFEIAFGRGKERVGWFGWTSTTKPARYDCVLSVSRVRAVKIEDEARIGIYDLNSVSFVSDDSAVVIEANIPLTITLAVEDIHVRVFTQNAPHTNEGGLSWYTEDQELREALEAWTT